MTSRNGLLGLLTVLIVAAAALGYRAFEDDVTPARPPSTTKRQIFASAAFKSTLTRLRDAEKVGDAYQRCVAYPDPPGIRWDPVLIAAFCRSRSFPHMQLDEIKAALDEGHADTVDAAFASYLADNYANPEKRGILTRVYRELFSSSSGQVGEVVRRWVALAPKSAFALAARGAYYQSAAGDARGGEFARDTPEENFRRMRQLASKAEADLREAVRLEPKLSAAYDSMIFVGQMTGNSELIDDALKGALDVDPTNERFYLDWMSTVEPRWGGSLPEMAQVARAAELHVQANPLLRLVSEKQRAYLGVIEMRNDNYPAALAAFEQALALAPSTVDLELAGEVAGKIGDHEKAIWFYSESFRFDRGQGASTLAKRAWELKQIGMTALAAQDLESVAALASSDEDTLYQQAWAYFARHDYPQAEKTYLKILERNPRNESALLDLVKLYAGLDQASNAKPLVARLQKLYPTVAETWLATASVICNDDKDGCRAALNRYLELADGKDPDEKQKIETARFQLEQLDKQSVPAKG